MDKAVENVSRFVVADHGDKLVAVVGDVMLDLYDQVRVSRISPEFPIPVMNCQGDDAYVVRPGGAANVCEQLKHFGAEVKLSSLLGHRATAAFEGSKFDTSWSLSLTDCHNPLKRRFYDGDYPLVRMDHEKSDYGLPQGGIGRCRDDLKEIFATSGNLRKPDVVILSDYGKGVFDADLAQWMVNWCRDAGVSTVVDPKRDQFQWKGCTIFKPNLAEASAFLRAEPSRVVADWERSCLELKRQVECESVVVTNGGEGVFGIDRGEPFYYRPRCPAPDVRSVIGAGDCFVAVFSLAIAQGYRVGDAAQVAYEAGAVYVQKKHNEAVWPHELVGRVEKSKSKILSPETIAAYCRGQKGKRVVWTNGCYDFGLTAGHIECIEFAKNNGDILIVGLNSDESVKTLKGLNRPIVTLSDRMKIVASLQSVDFVTHFNEETPLRVIEMIRPNLIVKGGDYNQEEVIGNTIAEVKICPLIKCKSTTEKIYESQV